MIKLTLLVRKLVFVGFMTSHWSLVLTIQQLPDINQWDLSLFDVQTYTEFDVSESITLTTPTFIKGENSGTAYLRHSVVGTAFTTYDVKGEFFLGERLSFSGATNDGRTVTDITNFETSDIKSVFSNPGLGRTFGLI